MDCDEVTSDDLYISVSSPDTLCKSSSRVSNEHGTPVCVLTIPNQLLLDWNDSNTTTFVSKANDNIINEIVTLRQEKRLENILASHARSIKSRAKNLRSGSKRQELLQKYTHVSVMAGETISIQEVINDNHLAQEQAEQYRAAAENLTIEIDGLREEFRKHTMNMENRGKPIDQVYTHNS